MKIDSSSIDVQYVATLASLVVTAKQCDIFRLQISSILKYMSKIQKLDTKMVEETSQVNGLINVFRDDSVDDDRMFTQEEALHNAKRTYRGFFVVDAILE